MTPQITPLPPAATEPLALMHASCFPDDPWDAAALGRILALSGLFGYLAWRAGDPAGFVLARDLGAEAEILTFGVLPAMRRQGIGSTLLDAVVGHARRRQLASIVLEVAADNEPARRLYAAHGFGQVGHRPRYYRRPGGVADAIILRRGIRREDLGPSAPMK